jgi:hypothetical protein
MADPNEIDVVIYHGGTVELQAVAPRLIAVELAKFFPAHKLAERGRFVMMNELAAKVLAGVKVTTVRFVRGGLDFPGAASLPLFEVRISNLHDDAIWVADLRISRVVYKRVVDLTEEDVRNDGRANLVELLETMQNFYGDISADDILSIYEFSVLPR